MKNCCTNSQPKEETYQNSGKKKCSCLFPLMVSVLDSRLNGPGSGPGRWHCLVFLGKTLYPHSASLQTGVQMGTGEMNAEGNSAIN